MEKFEVFEVRVRSANGKMATRYRVKGPFNMGDPDHSAARSYEIRELKVANNLVNKLNEGLNG